MRNRIEGCTHLVWLVKGKREGELGKTNIKHSLMLMEYIANFFLVWLKLCLNIQTRHSVSKY